MPRSLKVCSWNIQGDTFRDGQPPHDLSAEFSATDNPRGVWGFGYAVQAGAARQFIRFDRHDAQTTAAGTTQA